MKIIAILLISILQGFAVERSRPALLPMPQKVTWGDDVTNLNLAYLDLKIAPLMNVQTVHLLLELNELLPDGKELKGSESVKISVALGSVEAPHNKKEAYEIVSNKNEIKLTANTPTGLYRGVQTLRQLIVKKQGETTIAHCEITDYPAFKVRGVMHDVGRNFQSIDQLKMQIDIMARYKMNVFHWHLTDHFGWRLESKKYPDLQADGSFVRGVGKYYTQAEFKDMVEYCWKRHITIIPEFDSPGHSEAFRHGVGVKNMKESKAKEAMIELIKELCSLADAEKMPYIHLGTDEVRHAAERVNGDYLPALHKAVRDDGREVIGWWKGMVVKGDKAQILQTWARSNPMKGMKHIDSRSNYINHMEALDFSLRMFFQQPCRAPHGDEFDLGGILAHWPDTRQDDERKNITNNPVIPAIVAYAEAVWKGIAKDRPEYWAKLPDVNTAEYKAFADFENRLAEQRDRFFGDLPFAAFPFVKTHQIEWRLLGPVADGEVPMLGKGILLDLYDVEGRKYRWTKPRHGAAIHSKHFFGFSGHLKTDRKGKNVTWANTFIYSPKDQEVGAWIGFNTLSTSDYRAGIPKAGNWSANPLCKIWINDEEILPPVWQGNGKTGKEDPITNQIYTSREPARIKLKKGWNKVIVKSASHWKWVFSFSPVVKEGNKYSEVPGLKYSATLPKK